MLLCDLREVLLLSARRNRKTKLFADSLFRRLKEECKIHGDEYVQVLVTNAMSPDIIGEARLRRVEALHVIRMFVDDRVIQRHLSSPEGNEVEIILRTLKRLAYSEMSLATRLLIWFNVPKLSWSAVLTASCVVLILTVCIVAVLLFVIPEDLFRLRR